MPFSEGSASKLGKIHPMRTEGLESRDRRWRFALLALCGLSLAITLFGAADGLGIAGRPWFGWWDANAAISGQRFIVAVAQPRAGGASARGGLRDGDRIDLREQTLSTRMGVVYQPAATRPTVLRVHRGSATLTIAVTPSTVWEGVPAWKLPPVFSVTIASLWFMICALLIALRRWWDREARILALVLLCVTGAMLEPVNFVVLNGAAGVILLVVSRACATGALLLLVKLSSDFGGRSPVRDILERLAYLAILVGFSADVAAAVGLVTLWFDPLPYIFRISTLRGAIAFGASLLVALSAIAAVRSTPENQRPRASWLLLPLPLALVTSTAVATLVIFTKSWFANLAVILVSDGVILLSAFIVTYALLKRRVLDFEFVLSRTLVVATVSLIVVASFVLLEWLLGSVLADASHATGLVANAGLALALGLSLNAIHKRVDLIVDAVLFRKRHEDERALLDFAREAAYVTESNALLDQAIDKVQRHTDARSGAVLLDGDIAYSATRSFGDAAANVSENDGAILALKTWHKPIDPHRYQTALRGALALPMLARGRLLGVLLLGERAGGEAYAPNEVEALSQFAHGIGSALDALSSNGSRAKEPFQDTLELILTELQAMKKAAFSNSLRPPS